MGEFVEEHSARASARRFGGDVVAAHVDRDAVLASVLPALRGAVSSTRRTISHVDGSDEAVAFAGSAWAEALCRLGTSCPDHFLRTRISPMFVPWNAAGENVEALERRIG